MSWTNLLGIYPESIEKIFDTCEEALQPVREFVKKIGYDNDAEYLDFELHEEVLADLEDVGIQSYDITDSIIRACLNTTSGFLNNTELFRDLSIEMEGFANGYVSYLQINECCRDVAYDSCEMEQVLYDKFSDGIWNVLVNQILSENRDIPDFEGDVLKKTIINGLKGGEYSTADILACYRDGEVKGALRTLVDNYPVQERQAEKPVKKEQTETLVF